MIMWDTQSHTYDKVYNFIYTCIILLQWKPLYEDPNTSIKDTFYQSQWCPVYVGSTVQCRCMRIMHMYLGMFHTVLQ